MSLGETQDEAEANKSNAIQYKAESVLRKSVAKTIAPGNERFFIGSVEFIRERMQAYAEAGVTEMCVTFFESDAGRGYPSAGAVREARLS